MNSRPSLEEFDLLHTAHGEPLPAANGQWLLFEDGARRTARGHVSQIVFLEPDDHDVERLQARIEYYRERVRRADKEFKSIVERLRHEALDRHIAGIEHTGLSADDSTKYHRAKQELECSQRRLRELLNEHSELPIVKQIAATKLRATTFKAPV